MSSAIPRRRLTRTRWWLAGMAVLLVAILLVGWLDRRQLAGSYLDDLLAERGVPARYVIADLGPGGQRLTDVVIGDPVRPDLTADWVETRTRLGLNGAQVTGLRAGRVRVRGRIVDGRVSLGALDRLLPKSSGGPLTLPDIGLEVADGRMRLDTPAGPVGLKLAGTGNLRSGFRGTLAAVAPRLASSGCVVGNASGFWTVATTGGAARLTGPTRAATLTCGEWRASGLAAQVDARPGAALDRADGTARLTLAEVRSPTVWLKQLGGRVRLRGPLRAVQGDLALAAGPSAAFGASATAVRASGWFRIGPAQFNGTVAADHASVPARWRSRAAGLRGMAAGTPAGPLLDQLGPAVAAAGRDMQLRADLAFAQDALLIRKASTVARSGARISYLGIEALFGPAELDPSGDFTIGGGGLPSMQVALRRERRGAGVTGRAWMEAYAAGASRLVLTPVEFRIRPGGAVDFRTRATLSGPLGDGRIDEAMLALAGAWDGGGRLVLNPHCGPAGFRRLSVAGLTLAPASLSLCPVGRALVTLDHGRLGGGARIAAPRLTGALGGSPLTLAARGSELRFGDGGLQIDGLTARLGTGPSPSRLEVVSLTGRIAGSGIGGAYRGAGGQLGAVPLLMSDAAGGWRLANGVLTVDGGLTVADAATAAPRFRPLPVRDIDFRLADGRITAHGQLRAPDGVTRVADVTLTHSLARSTGAARIAVPGIAFDDKLLPKQLTPVVEGVVAGVRGTVSGTGLIRWSPAGVTSSGDFGTDNMDLAAAFGPVTGLKTRIHFTDLFALESAPGQVATIATINPGVPVADGVFRFQTLSGPRIRVEGARWPLAGGELILEPTLLDFSTALERRMTFRIAGLDARRFLQTFGYDNLDASGIFDGALPIVFDAEGGRLENGRLTARAGGTIAYRGEIAKENLGTWSNLAFGALRSLKFRGLDLTLDGPLAGNIVTRARFSGVAQGEGATRNFITRRLANLPFIFNVKIEAPFRSLIGSARSFYDPNILIEQNLPMLLREQERLERESKTSADGPIQPPASETKR